jgi:hypothetical protein
MTNEEANKALVEGFEVIETDGDIFNAPKGSISPARNPPYSAFAPHLYCYADSS